MVEILSFSFWPAFCGAILGPRNFPPPSALTEENSASAAEKSKLRLEQYKRFYGKIPDAKVGLYDLDTIKVEWKDK